MSLLVKAALYPLKKAPFFYTPQSHVFVSMLPLCNNDNLKQNVLLLINQCLYNGQLYALLHVPSSQVHQFDTSQPHGTTSFIDKPSRDSLGIKNIRCYIIRLNSK